MSASIASSMATRSSSSVSLSHPSSWITIPGLKPSRSAGPVWAVPPPAVELTGASSRPPTALYREVWSSPAEKGHGRNPCPPTALPKSSPSACGKPLVTWDDEGVTEETSRTSGTRSGSQPSVIHEGLPTQLPDIDPDETQD